MKSKKIKSQDSLRSGQISTKKRPHRKNGVSLVNEDCSSSTLSSLKLVSKISVKKNLLKGKQDALCTKQKTAGRRMFPCLDADELGKNSAISHHAEGVSEGRASFPQTKELMLPTSADLQLPTLSISEALSSLLSAVKALVQQHCLLAMMEVDIQFGSRPDAVFQPKTEDWPQLQRLLQSLHVCLQDLQDMVNAEQAAAMSQLDPPTYEAEQQTPDGGDPAQLAVGPVSGESVSGAGPGSPPPAPEQQEDQTRDQEDQERDQEDQEEPDWSPAEEETFDSPWSPPPPPAARPAKRNNDRKLPFVCTNGDCQKQDAPPRFASEKSLRMHEAARHGRRAAGRRYSEYTCPLCGSGQKRPCDLAAHIVTCQGKGEPRASAAPDGDAPGSDGASFIMCRLCHLCFPSGELLRAHKCQYADDDGVIQELLGTGALSVSGSELSALRRFICHQCREEFRNQAIYRVHLQFCRPPPYACELCGEMLPCGRRLVAHKMKEHRSLNKPMFFCRAAGCGLSFRLNAALQKHLVRRHSSQPTGQPHGCDVCDKKFIKKIYLTHHKLRYHHDTLRRDFVCDMCGARLGSSSALTVHVRALHTRPEFTCDVCGNVFSRQDRLAVHAKIHTGVKPYKCTLCPKAFIQQCKLNDHLRRHRGERRFRCVMCDKMYAASHDLRAHLRRIHNVDMVNKTHTIQPASSLLRPLPPPEPNPEPEPEPEPVVPAPPEPAAPDPQRTQQLPAVVPQTLQSVQLHSVQMAAPAQTLHVQDLSQLGGGLILIPAVDAGGATSFYPIINQ